MIGSTALHRVRAMGMSYPSSMAFDQHGCCAAVAISIRTSTYLPTLKDEGESGIVLVHNCYPFANTYIILSVFSPNPRCSTLPRHVTFSAGGIGPEAWDRGFHDINMGWWRYGHRASCEQTWAYREPWIKLGHAGWAVGNLMRSSPHGLASNRGEVGILRVLVRACRNSTLACGISPPACLPYIGWRWGLSDEYLFVILQPGVEDDIDGIFWKSVRREKKVLIWSVLTSQPCRWSIYKQANLLLCGFGVGYRYLLMSSEGWLHLVRQVTFYN